MTPEPVQNLLNELGLFYQDDNNIYHVIVKKIVFKEIYGMDFDVKDLKCRYLLTLHQKLSLEENLKQILPSYFSQHYTPDNEMMLDSHKTLNSFYKDIDNNNNNQDDFGSIRSHDDYISHQNESGAGTYMSYIHHP
ncbi:unnamed protein product [Rhizophagus irregularis]|nr:unnamed protein product [Rhizophagus irregularis]